MLETTSWLRPIACSDLHLCVAQASLHPVQGHLGQIAGITARQQGVPGAGEALDCQQLAHERERNCEQNASAVALSALCACLMGAGKSAGNTQQLIDRDQVNVTCH